jgi:hypothetical protein
VTGARGATGKEGNETRRQRKKHVSAVMGHINRIDRELGIQLARMGQIQREVDELRAKLRDL